MREQIEALERTRNELFAQIEGKNQRSGNELVDEARILNTQIRNAYDRLLARLSNSGANARSESLVGFIRGQFELTTTHKDAPGPYAQPITLPIRIVDTMFIVGSFTVKFPPFPTPIGDNTMTITKASGGVGSYNAGQIVVPVVLRIDHSVTLGDIELDSTLNLVLSTNPPGSPITPAPNGAVRLFGSGVFDGGFLAGVTGTISIAGVSDVAPRPNVEVPDVLEVGRDVAIRYLKDAKLEAKLTGVNSPDSWVYRQTPKGGEMVPEGSTVTLLLRDGPIP